MHRIDEVYDDLRERIFEAQFKPNEMITEREISEHYGVSKVTAGEALHRLCHEGHLTAYPRTGYMVTALTPLDMRQIKRVRIALETLVVEVLCQEREPQELSVLYDYIVENPTEEGNPSAANRRFHMAMAGLTEDPYLISVIGNMLGAASRVEQYVSPEKMATWQDFHRDIVDALCEKNVEKAREKLWLDLNQR